MKKPLAILIAGLALVGAGCSPAEQNGWATFADPGLGLSFAYPEAWGRPEIREEQGTQGEGGEPCVSQRTAFFPLIGESGDIVLVAASTEGCEQPGRGGYWGDAAHGLIPDLAYLADCETGRADLCETLMTRSGEQIWHHRYPSYELPFSDQRLENVDRYALHREGHELSGIMASEERLLQNNITNADADLRRLVESIAFLPAASGGEEARLPAYADYFSWKLDPKYQLEERGDYARVQNFISSDDPRVDYPPSAFFLEAFLHDAAGLADEASWREGYDRVTEKTLAGRRVLYGEGRHVAGEGWPGTSYFVPGVATFNLSAQAAAGLQLAEAVMKTVAWKPGLEGHRLFAPEMGPYSFSLPFHFHATSAEDPYARLEFVHVAFRSDRASYHPANYSQDQWFAVSVGNIAEQQCYAPLPEGGQFGGFKTIGGTEFRVAEATGAAAGNRYEQTFYRTHRNGQCYEIATTLHYASDFAGVDEAAMKKSQEEGRAMLEEAVETFRFSER